MTDTPEFTLDHPHGWQTRDGRKVRILCCDAQNATYPIVGLIADYEGVEEPQTWTEAGTSLFSGPEKSDDLINSPAPRKTVWVNWYSDFIGGPHDSREEADTESADGRFACTEIPVPDEGTGLDGISK